jgi:F0F1-type ATP synthase assembly protein I
VYGVLGWLADRLLGTSFLVAVGILVGAGFGIYMTFARFNTMAPRDGAPGSTPNGSSEQD